MISGLPHPLLHLAIAFQRDWGRLVIGAAIGTFVLQWQWTVALFDAGQLLTGMGNFLFFAFFFMGVLLWWNRRGQTQPAISLAAALMPLCSVGFAACLLSYPAETVHPGWVLGFLLVLSLAVTFVTFKWHDFCWAHRTLGTLIFLLLLYWTNHALAPAFLVLGIRLVPGFRRGLYGDPLAVEKTIAPIKNLFLGSHFSGTDALAHFDYCVPQLDSFLRRLVFCFSIKRAGHFGSFSSGRLWSQSSGMIKGESERASGALYRVEVEGRPVVSHLTLPLEMQWDEKTLTLVIENADSQPFEIQAIRAGLRPVILCFQAAQAGQYKLCSGNPYAVPPRYDLASLGSELALVHGISLPVGPLQDNSQIQKTAAIPMLEELGAAIDSSAWRQQLPVEIRQSGIQSLTLNLAVLTQADEELRDVRLVRDGRQIPYLIESANATAWLEPKVAPMEPDSKRKASLWKLLLPYRRIPALVLSCALPNAIFERQVRVYEEVASDRGRTFQLELGRAFWRQTPSELLPEGLLKIGAPQSNTLLA